ncbi:MAG TPA: hypothetical protein DCY27_08495 [Desulfobacterales bacterium]|nr:hypothetical protein [Desulfobacterales bacterium]
MGSTLDNEKELAAVFSLQECVNQSKNPPAWQFPAGKGFGQGPHCYYSRPVNVRLYPPGHRGLIFSSGRFTIINWLIGAVLLLSGMSLLKGSQEKDWPGKIAGECHFPAKPDSILPEDCPGAGTVARRDEKKALLNDD